MTDIRCLNDAHGKSWSLYHGDCVDVLSQMPDACIDFSIFSPPFSNLFVYSDSAADMGNSTDDAAFLEHYGFLARELARVTKPGRLVAVHCSDLPLFKWKDGMIGLRDFSGMLIRAHEEHDWILHTRVTIRKSPVTEMQRTKSIGLLYQQVQKDSTMSRVGMPDYLLVFRMRGENAEPVAHDPKDFPLSQWQDWAEPVWMDINMADTLNVQNTKGALDERHIAPLQLGLIKRALTLWSNPGDTVLSPFAGLGSEGYVSVKEGRRFIGTELKPEYFQTAIRNLKRAETAPIPFSARRVKESAK